MTVLSAVQKACVESLAIEKPDQLFSGQDTRELQELQETANSAALYIVSDYDWPALKKLETITGDGTTTAFDLPNDYGRMLVKTQLWSSRLQGPLEHVTSDDTWLGILTTGTFSTFGSWILYADQIHIQPAPALDETVTYFYVKDKFALSEAGTAKALFSADTDTFALDETLLKLGIVWHFKQSKGLQYEEDLATYEKYKEQLIVRAKGSRILMIGQPRWPGDVSVAYPFAVGT